MSEISLDHYVDDSGEFHAKKGVDGEGKPCLIGDTRPQPCCIIHRLRYSSILGALSN
jgi:hypothetical protein